VVSGLEISRVFTKKGVNVYDSIDFVVRESMIKNPDGSIVFQNKTVEVPSFWSQTATDILAQKYFKRAKIPECDESGYPIKGTKNIGGESSVKQVVNRLAGCWRSWGEETNMFASKDDADAFEDELKFMLVNQMVAPNSPQWFNTGLYWMYGYSAPSDGHFYFDEELGKVVPSDDAYKRPQPHACGRYDTLLFSEQGIIQLGEIVEKDLTGLKVFDGEKFVRIIATKNNGVRTLFRATLSNGNYIDFTDDHPVLSSQKRLKDFGSYEWNYLRDIVGYKVVQSSNLMIAEKNEVFNKNLVSNASSVLVDMESLLVDAELAGWVVGDGYFGQYGKTTMFGVITINGDEFSHVSSLFEKKFGSFTFTTKREISPDYKIIRHDFKEVTDFVLEYNLNKNSFTASVPQKILSSPKVVQSAFLRSLFQADGCVRIRKENNRNSGDIVLSTISEKLAHQTQAMLLNLGIYSRVSLCNDSRSNRHPLYQIVISYFSERKKFEEFIGFISAEKKEKLALLNSLVIGKNKKPVSEETVVSIEEIGVETVYDIQTESGKFSANGVVVHNCFIQHVKDSLMEEGGIFDLIRREGRLFKHGSGTGTNFSTLRGKGESLSGGGISSGLMSYLKIYDTVAGSIKSGGTTRRAAKMVALDIDHPEIKEFIDWKMEEEKKVADMVAGSKVCNKYINGVMKIAFESKEIDPEKSPALKFAIKKAVANGVPLNYVFRALQLASQGKSSMTIKEYNTHFEGDAYYTVAGQNSNNSVVIPNSFFDALDKGANWNLTWRTNGKICETLPAKTLWDKICFAAWNCADPGVMFYSTINEWHTCPANGPIRSSNPCSEYFFLDNSACNLASINLKKFLDIDLGKFKTKEFMHAVRLWTIVLEISIVMAQFPAKEIADITYKTRSLGLGYANIGSVLMLLGKPYDSEDGRSIAASITSLMSAVSYKTSAEMAAAFGPFKEFEKNKENMLRVISNHRTAAYSFDDSKYVGLTIKPQKFDDGKCQKDIVVEARAAWDDALKNGKEFGFRNAQVTLLAPTGTIGLLMDCDTTGLEPDFALVKFKKLAGGGYFKIINNSVPFALKNLNYDDKQIEDIGNYLVGHGTLEGCSTISFEKLRAKKFGDKEIELVRSSLKGAFDIKFVFNKYILGEEFCKSIGFTSNELDDPNFNMLLSLGFSKNDIEEANKFVCGAMTIEGAPHLKEEHLPVFDCANKCGKYGKRFILWDAHIKMMASVQPFLSGAISKTINMPSNATIAEVEKAYLLSWKSMLKSNALYRDGSKLSQPLNAVSGDIAEELLQVAVEEDVDENINTQKIPSVIDQKVERKRLPKKRRGLTQEVIIGGHKVFIQTGEYDDGALGEVFVSMYKEGAAYRSLLACFAVAISKALQYGVPLEEFVDSFTFTRFEPAGMVQGHDAIKTCTSILDFVFRFLGYEYLGRTDFVHVKPLEEVKETQSKVTVQTILVNNSASSLESVKERPLENSFDKPASKSAILADPKISDARSKGYTGEACRECGSMKVRRNGTCTVCEDCGSTSGCS